MAETQAKQITNYCYEELSRDETSRTIRLKAVSDTIPRTTVTPENPIKNGIRSKLNFSDIKLLLYLIICIKPFKYIGDTSCSQMNKWEKVQRQFFKMKSKSPLSEAKPTIRTLQRQLNSAVQKARTDHKIDLNNTTYQSITSTSSIESLEIAVLELFELSEARKSGNLPLYDKNGHLEDKTPKPVTKSDIYRLLNGPESSEVDTEQDSNLSCLLKAINEHQNLLKSTDEKITKLLNDKDRLVKECSLLQQQKTITNRLLLDKISRATRNNDLSPDIRKQIDQIANK